MAKFTSNHFAISFVDALGWQLREPTKTRRKNGVSATMEIIDHFEKKVHKLERRDRSKKEKDSNRERRNWEDQVCKQRKEFQQESSKLPKHINSLKNHWWQSSRIESTQHSSRQQPDNRDAKPVEQLGRSVEETDSHLDQLGFATSTPSSNSSSEPPPARNPKETAHPTTIYNFYSPTTKNPIAIYADEAGIRQACWRFHRRTW